MPKAEAASHGLLGSWTPLAVVALLLNRWWPLVAGGCCVVLALLVAMRAATSA